MPPILIVIANTAKQSILQAFPEKPEEVLLIISTYSIVIPLSFNNF